MASLLTSNILSSNYYDFFYVHEKEYKLVVLQLILEIGQNSRA